MQKDDIVVVIVIIIIVMIAILNSQQTVTIPWNALLVLHGMELAKWTERKRKALNTNIRTQHTHTLICISAYSLRFHLLTLNLEDESWIFSNRPKKKKKKHTQTTTQAHSQQASAHHKRPSRWQVNEPSPRLLIEPPT